MTIHEALLGPSRQPLMTFLILLVILQMYLVVTSSQSQRSRKIQAFHSLHLATGLVFFYFSMLDISWEFYFPGEAKAFPAVLSAFNHLSASAMVLFETMTGCILAAAFLELAHFRRSHPTFDSLKETMDLLPVGIAFGKPDGDVVLSNITMNDLSRAVTGKGLTDLSVFNRKINDKVTLNDDSSTWQFIENPLEVGGKMFRQLTATNITIQEKITKDLEDKNTKLRDLHMRLDIYNKQADRIIISQELLTARMAVHSEVGSVLLESRHYLTDPSSFDEERLLQALKNTNTYLLREYEEDDTERDPLADALEMAEAIGVDVMITGRIPSENPYRSILSAAIDECASNTVKHADGDELKVSIQKTANKIIFILQSNGKSPENGIRESGGLLSLRTLVEQENGTMETQVSPGFMLIIKMTACQDRVCSPGAG